VPGNKIKTKVLRLSGFKKRLHPIGIIGSGSRTADFIYSITSTGGNGFGGSGVESGIGRGFLIVPVAKQIGLVVDLVINAGNVFLDGITIDGGFN